MSKPLLQVDALYKRYGDQIAVANLSFTVEEGEFVTLLGPSGCGKSTTLMSIAGFVRPDGGSIRLRGNEITGLPPERRALGMMFQSYALFPHLTVLDNVLFPLSLRRLPRAAAVEKARGALDLVQLDADNSMPAQLSGGQQQRVALARAIVFDPELLLLDEPLGALDRRLRQELQEQFAELRSRLNATVLWVTHDQEEALALSDRVIVMRAGYAEQIDTPWQVYRHPSSRFVASFLGDSNQVPVTIVRKIDRQLEVQLPSSCQPRVVRVADTGATTTSGWLLIRPEEVQVLSSRAATDAEVVVPGSILGSTYLGHVGRVATCDTANLQWKASVSGAVAQEMKHKDKGTPVTLAWAPSAAHLVSDSSGHDEASGADTVDPVAARIGA